MAMLALPALMRGADLLPLPERRAAMSERIRASNGQVYTYMPPHPAEMEFTDWLDHELAIEDHKHGMAYGDDASHCGECATEATRRRQATCEHANVTSVVIRTLDSHITRWLRSCDDCGLELSEEISVAPW